MHGFRSLPAIFVSKEARRAISFKIFKVLGRGRTSKNLRDGDGVVNVGFFIAKQAEIGAWKLKRLWNLESG